MAGIFFKFEIQIKRKKCIPWRIIFADSTAAHAASHLSRSMSVTTGIRSAKDAHGIEMIQPYPFIHVQHAIHLLRMLN
jgi:hypothetical protein